MPSEVRATIQLTSVRFKRTVLQRPLLLAAAALVAASGPAAAHVKWFAPYIVDASPQPIAATLTNTWFWAGIALVLAFFLVAIAIERRSLGQNVLAAMDRVTAPVALRADDFMRAATAAFFVAIFAVGGVYLTPDLQTPSELVSWAQLAIAAGIFSRRTMPFSAAGIIALWLIALRDYDFFHLLDYLALGVGVAGYLLLAFLDDQRWREKRFAVLFWGVAIALMWSSLEKFAYPEWFYPLVEEKPFLTFGLPRDVFIPMAGVAEFTLGFGLIWSPLVRRLSAISLLVTLHDCGIPFRTHRPHRPRHDHGCPGPDRRRSGPQGCRPGHHRSASGASHAAHGHRARSPVPGARGGCLRLLGSPCSILRHRGKRHLEEHLHPLRQRGASARSRQCEGGAAGNP